MTIHRKFDFCLEDFNISIKDNIDNLDLLWITYMHLVEGTHHNPAAGNARGTPSLGTSCACSRAAVPVLGRCLWWRIDVLVHVHEDHELQRFLLIGNLQGERQRIDTFTAVS